MGIQGRESLRAGGPEGLSLWGSRDWGVGNGMRVWAFQKTMGGESHGGRKWSDLTRSLVAKAGKKARPKKVNQCGELPPWNCLQD